MKIEILGDATLARGTIIETVEPRAVCMLVFVDGKYYAVDLADGRWYSPGCETMELLQEYLAGNYVILHNCKLTAER